MINHNSFYRSLTKKGDTIILLSNDQPRYEPFSIGEVGCVSGASEGRVLGASFRSGNGGQGEAPCNRATMPDLCAIL